MKIEKVYFRKSGYYKCMIGSKIRRAMESLNTIKDLVPSKELYKLILLCIYLSITPVIQVQLLTRFSFHVTHCNVFEQCVYVPFVRLYVTFLRPYNNE